MNRQDSPVSVQASLAAASRLKVSDGCLALLATLLALAVRLPYWRTIPAAGDEVNQAAYALRIAQGHGFPLVGNDAYAGPFFFYLLALLFRLGVADPFVARTVVLIAGTLTATVTYAWGCHLHGNRVASLVATALVAANPHLVLLNSHVGGTTFLLPFLTTSFLWLLSRAVNSDHRGWLIASAVAAGLAIQSNPVAGLLVAGGWTWVTFRVRRSPRLGRHWPLWPLVGGLCVALLYSPVIAYNVTSGMRSINVLDQRSYLWEASPTVRVFLSNELRLATQLVRQVSGVLTGDETFRTLLGMPLLYLAWMPAGLAFVTRRISLLPALAVLPFFLLLPCLSSHYGLIDPVRFTSLLTPVFAVGMGFLFAAVLERVVGLIRSKGIARPPVVIAVSALVVTLVAYPLVSLFQYYDFIEENRRSGRALLGLSRQMVKANQGEPVYISTSLRTMGISGIPYVPEAYLLFANIYQEFLPPEQIVGRLFEFPRSAFMLISDEDAATIRRFASLTRRPSAANEEAHRLGYGLYTPDTAVPLVKPDFVLTGNGALDVAPGVPVGVLVGGGVEFIGYDVPASVATGETLTLTLYWRAVGPIPYGTYIGFAHLYDPATMTLVAQDDHVLGQDQYPVNAWQPDEVVVDRYAPRVPDDAAPGRYALRAGAYTWPDLTRLDVPEHPDDVIELGAVDVGE
jgi:4-amino-4-deoxy-L-arabinose transferase-like glycosyltransferase